MKGGAIEERLPSCKSRNRPLQEALNNFDSREIRTQIDIINIAIDLNNISYYFIYKI